MRGYASSNACIPRALAKGNEMAIFTIENGQKGEAWCKHTATGYECSAIHPLNQEQMEPSVHFIMRYVMGTEGIPCIELGFKGLSENEYGSHKRKLEQLLTAAEFEHVSSFTDRALPERAFMHADDAEWKSVTVKIVHANTSMSELMDIFQECVADKGYNFIKEQEEVDNVLFKSMLYCMGPSLMKGGGYDQQTTMQKIALLAQELGAIYQPHQFAEAGAA